MSTWATEVLPWFQIVGTFFTAIAAVAAAFSARAALRTAGRADETSRRSVEALGRTMMPLLSVTFSADSAQFLVRGPVPVMLDVVNNGSNRGLVLAAEFRRSDGVTQTTTAPLPQVIGTTVTPYLADFGLALPMGEMVRLLPSAQVDADSDVVITTEIVFADVSRLVTWRQRARWQERAQISADGRPNYSYVVIDESGPEMVGNQPRSENRVARWDHRTWRYIQ